MNYNEIENQQIVDDILEYQDSDPYLVELMDLINELKEGMIEQAEEIGKLKSLLIQNGININEQT